MTLQIKAFINEAHYYADATIMFPVWPPEPKLKYKHGLNAITESLGDDGSAQLSGTGSNTGSNNCRGSNISACERPLTSLHQAEHYFEGSGGRPQDEVTGWGIWMAERLWAEIQFQHKQARLASTVAPVMLA